MKILTLTFLALASPVFACPTVIDTIGERDALLQDLSKATDFSTTQAAAGAVWAFWHIAPDEQAQEWLDEGVARIRQSDLGKAEQVLQGLVDYCPNYAEGYNQLAFAQYLADDLTASEENLKRTLELEPRHFGALSGLGLIAQKRGNLPVAKIWIKRAVKIHPFLNERFILDIPEKTDEL